MPLRPEKEPPPPPDPAWRRRFRRRLLAWFDRCARDLPWRRTRDPYRVWVSEVMLQQTQVATAQTYFERFVAAFPTVRDLAAADLAQVLRVWEGLGYYRRARQLHAAARIIVQQHGGRFPREQAAVEALPGVGPYTAGAVLSIAFGQRAPIVDTNAARVLSRLAAHPGDPSRAASRRFAWSWAAALTPRADPGRFNQALMELGSQVCTAREPQCGRCPVVPLCEAFRQGRQHAIPRPAARPQPQRVSEAAVAVRRGSDVLLRRCGPHERWAGLWDFPRFPWEADGEGSSEGQNVYRALAAELRRATGVAARIERPLPPIRYSVTRFRVLMRPYAATYLNGRPRRGLGWFDAKRLDELPLCASARRLAAAGA